jgi:hypothetical protein
MFPFAASIIHIYIRPSLGSDVIVDTRKPCYIMFTICRLL